MFCALNGATATPRRAKARHSPVVTTLLPASEVVPATRRPVISAAPRSLGEAVRLAVGGVGPPSRTHATRVVSCDDVVDAAEPGVEAGVVRA